jgi:hypothetical protein
MNSHADAGSSGDDAIRDMQDLYLNAESRSQTARDNLAEMVDARRRQNDEIVAAFSALEQRAIASEHGRVQAESENAVLQRRVAELESHNNLLHRNYTRLYEANASMLQMVEDTRRLGFGVDKRIEAMLVHSELGGASHHHAPSRRVVDFNATLFPEGNFASRPQARREHPVSHAIPQEGGFPHPSEAHRQPRYAHDEYPAHNNAPYRQER